MKHSWSSEKDHGTRFVSHRSLKRFDMFEIEHISFCKGLFDLLVGPTNEEAIVKVCLLSETLREVNRDLEVHALPVGFHQNTKFLCSTQCKYWNEHLSTTLHTFMNAFQEITLTLSFRVTDGGSIRRLRDQEVWTQLINGSCAKMTIRCHVIVPSVHHRFFSHTNVEHRCTKDVASVVRLDLHIITNVDGFVQMNSSNFVHTILDVFRGIKVGETTTLHRDLAIVFKKNWTDRFGWMCHENRTRKANHLSKVRQCTTVIQMKVSDDDSIDDLIHWSGLGEVCKVREAAFILIAHVHSTIEHYSASSQRHHNAATTHILPSTKRHDTNARCR
mmetsp:Transcript_11327/g.34703  ORF Transcript_11327/g.34703 Transcript_11327/m.34703 type:complete len:331 (+) Transcript_11327:1351-2343(+)